MKSRDIPFFDRTEAVLMKGITLRDWFAGQVLMGLSANSEYQVEVAKQTMRGGICEGENCADVMAEHAYKHADAMMKQRGKK